MRAHSSLACAALALLGCAPAPTPVAQPAPGALNLLLVTIDTLRADRVVPSELSRTPELDPFVTRGTIYTEVRASSSWTLPSMASLFTGRWPSEHRCWTLSSRLSPEEGTLAERLYERGWDTAAIVANHLVGRQYGLDQGFGWYDDELAQAAVTPELYARETSGALVDRGLDWLRARDAARATGGATRPWFLWLHLFDPHKEYLAHEGLASAHDDPLTRYEAEIAHTDRELGRLFDALDELELGANTLVVVTSDHGEEFGEHGGEDHGHTLYEELVRVPLIVVGPGSVSGRDSGEFSQLHLFDALLSAAERGRWALSLDNSVSCELYTRTGGLSRSLVHEDWKAILHADGRHELYDLSQDPGEQRDRSALEPERMQHMRELIERSATGRSPSRAEERIELSPADAIELDALGYGG